MHVWSVLLRESVSTTFPFGASINGSETWLSVPLVFASGLLPAGLYPLVVAMGRGPSGGLSDSGLDVAMVVWIPLGSVAVKLFGYSADRMIMA